MWLLLIKCSLYDIYNIICISIIFAWQYIDLDIRVLMLLVCWCGEHLVCYSGIVCLPASSVSVFTWSLG